MLAAAATTGVESSAVAPGELTKFKAALEAVQDARAKLLNYYRSDATLLETSPVFAPKKDVLLRSRVALAMLGRRAGIGGRSGKEFVIGIVSVPCAAR